MRNRIRRLRKAAIVWLVLSGLAGCVSTSSVGSGPVLLRVTPDGTVRFQNHTCSPEELPSRLARAGVDTQQEIRVQLEDVRNHRPLLARVYGSLVPKGYQRVLIVDAPRASAEVSGEPATRVEAPVNSRLPMPPPADASR